jgi:hypothetical protein
MSMHGTHVHNRRTRLHVRDGVFAVQEHRPEIDAEDFVPVLIRQIHKGLEGHHGSVIHHHVYTAPFAHRDVNGRFDVVWIAYVSFGKDGLAARACNRLHSPIAVLLFQIHHHNLTAFPGKALASGFANP